MSSDIEDTIDIVRKGGDWLVYFRSDPVTFTDQARALRDWLEDMIPHCRDCCIDRVCDGCAASERAYDTHMTAERGPSIPDCQTCREHAELDLPIPCMACALDGRREEYEEMERDRRAEP